MMKFEERKTMEVLDLITESMKEPPNSYLL